MKARDLEVEHGLVGRIVDLQPGVSQPLVFRGAGQHDVDREIARVAKRDAG